MCRIDGDIDFIWTQRDQDMSDQHTGTNIFYPKRTSIIRSVFAVSLFQHRIQEYLSVNLIIFIEQEIMPIFLFHYSWGHNESNIQIRQTDRMSDRLFSKGKGSFIDDIELLDMSILRYHLFFLNDEEWRKGNYEILGFVAKDDIIYKNRTATAEIHVGGMLLLW